MQQHNKTIKPKNQTCLREERERALSSQRVFKGAWHTGLRCVQFADDPLPRPLKVPAQKDKTHSQEQEDKVEWVVTTYAHSVSGPQIS